MISNLDLKATRWALVERDTQAGKSGIRPLGTARVSYFESYAHLCRVVGPYGGA